MPPFLTASSPGVGGHIRSRPADFFVQEIQRVEPSGEGEHVLFEIRKTGITTQEAVKRISRRLKVHDRAIGFAGLKDKHAVTQQLLSVQGASEAQVMQLQADDLGVLWAARHGRKLKRGASGGNRFAIKIRGVEPTGVVKLRPILATLEKRGVPNFFGPQRFGNRGDNAERGKQLLAGEIKVPAWQRSVLLSSVQSAVFNHVLSERLEQFDVLLDGDVAYKHDSGGCFAVPEAAVEQPRAERFEISPTGPMPGPKMLATTGRPGEMEQAAMAAFHVSPGTFASERGFPGERRPLRVPLVGGQLASGIDEFGPHITAAFTLPPGSYATSVLRELMKTDDMDASPEHRDTPPVEGLAQRPGTPDGKV